MFFYEVTFREESESKREKGIISGHSFSEAAKKLEDFYGKDYLVSIEDLYELEDPLLKIDMLEAFGVKGIDI